MRASAGSPSVTGPISESSPELEPMISGTSATWPRAKAWAGGLGHQPAVDEGAVVAVDRRPASRPGWRAARPRWRRRRAGLGQRRGAVGLLVGQGRRRGTSRRRISTMAFWYSPLAAGVASRASVLMPAGAISPKTVTFFGIAAEGRDVPLHPLQRRDLVHQAVVADRLAGLGGLGQRRMGEVAQRAQAVVDRSPPPRRRGRSSGRHRPSPRRSRWPPPWIQTITGALLRGLRARRR